MSDAKTYSERDARDWQRALAEKDAEIARLRAALKPFAEFAKAYGPAASALDYPEDHVLLAEPPAGNPAVVRLADLYAALEAIVEKV